MLMRMSALADSANVCRINKCGVISPRYNIKHNEIEAWVGRLLPSRQVSDKRRTNAGC